MQIVSERDTYAWNAKAYFPGKVREDITNVSSAESAQRVVKVKS